MKQSRIGAWIAIAVGALYFLVPLIGTFEFSLRMRRGVYSFDAYRVVLTDPRFQATFGYSTILAFATIIVGVILVVPTAYWIQLRLPRLRPIVEFITLLPLVIPAIVLVFGYLRIYGSSSFLPLTSNERATDVLLMFSYVTLALPYMARFNVFSLLICPSAWPLLQRVVSAFCTASRSCCSVRAKRCIA